MDRIYSALCVALVLAIFSGVLIIPPIQGENDPLDDPALVEECIAAKINFNECRKG